MSNEMSRLAQALCDPENQPHQWIGNSEELLEVIGARLEAGLAGCRTALAAAEAREQRRIDDIEELYEMAHKLGPGNRFLDRADYAAFKAASERDDHTALGAYVEQQTLRVLDVVLDMIEHGHEYHQTSYWTDAENDALVNVVKALEVEVEEAHSKGYVDGLADEQRLRDAALEQARAEGYKRGTGFRECYFAGKREGAAKERERCARIAANEYKHHVCHPTWYQASQKIAEAIRNTRER